MRYRVSFGMAKALWESTEQLVFGNQQGIWLSYQYFGIDGQFGLVLPLQHGCDRQNTDRS